jgi:hypothetical protein
MSAAKQAGGKGKIEKCKQRAAQKKRTHTTWKSTQTQPLLLAVDYFAAALECMLDDDWCRTWAAGRTIMLRRTSKRVKEVVDKMRLPAVVRLSRRFWDDARNGTAAQKLQFVLRQLAAMTAQCPALAYLDLCSKKIEAGGAERLGGVLAQRWLISISATIRLDQPGQKGLAVLGQCPALAHLNLSNNQIEAAGEGSIASVLAQCAALAHLNLCNNNIGAGGAESLAGVLAQCPALAHLNLGNIQIGPAGAERLAGVLAQCAALE